MYGAARPPAVQDQRLAMALQNLYELFRNNEKSISPEFSPSDLLTGCQSHRIKTWTCKFLIKRQKISGPSPCISLLLSEWLLWCSQPRCDPLWKVPFADHAIQHQYDQRGYQQQTEHSAMNAETPHLKLGVIFGRQLLPLVCLRFQLIAPLGVIPLCSNDVSGGGRVLGSRNPLL